MRNTPLTIDGYSFKRRWSTFYNGKEIFFNTFADVKIWAMERKREYTERLRKEEEINNMWRNACADMKKRAINGNTI